MDKLLNIVENITTGDRRRDYGSPLVNHIRIAIMWSVYLQKRISPIDVAYLMDLMKAAREIQTSKFDNAVDTAGYMACVDSMIEDWTKYRHDFIKNKELALQELRNITMQQMWDYLLHNIDK